MRRADTLPLIAAAPVLALLGWWAFAGGGYAPTVWYPGALALLGLMVVLTMSGALSLPRRRPLAIALAALSAYTAWSYLSIIWAGSPGDAVEGSHRTLLYLLAFTTMALVRWTRAALMIAVGVWIGIVTAAAVVTTLSLGGEGSLDLIIDARLSEPMGYMNADPALWTMAALPAIYLGSRRETPLIVRPLLIAAAALLIQLSVLSQSRGWLFTLPVVLGLAMLIVPGRLRAAIFALPVAAAAAFSARDLLEPYDVGGSELLSEVAVPLREALAAAASSAWAGAGIALLAAALLVAVDRFAPVPKRVRGAVRPLSAIVLAVAVLGAAAATVTLTDGHPIERLQEGWADFKDFDNGNGPGTARFSELGSTRYDFWRVSTDLWREHPLLGVGQDNFAEDYVQRRQTSREETRWAHSLQLRLLTHTGLVGLLLMLTAGVAIALAAGVHQRGRAGRPAAMLALLPGVYWLVHGSLDWLWEYPVLSTAAFALAGAAAGLGTRLSRYAGEPRPAPLTTRTRALVGVPAALLAVTVAGWLATAFLAERNLTLGRQGFSADRELGLDRFARARALNPFGAEAALLEGLAAARLGQPDRARLALREAITRSPNDWFAPFELALMPGQPDARALLRRAQVLNPREPLIPLAMRRLETANPLTQADAARFLRARVTKRFGA
ncbi:MAG: O-antigen ligase family protein [Solirubrobacteraceae bacterium]